MKIRCGSVQFWERLWGFWMPGCLLLWSVIPCGMGEDICLVLHSAGTFVTPQASLVTPAACMSLEMACVNGSKHDAGQRAPCWGTQRDAFTTRGKKRRKALRVLRGSLLWHKLSWKSLSMSQSLLKGNSLQGHLQAHYGMGPTPGLYRQNSWGNNRAELWESASSFCWVHCHQNTDQLKGRCYFLP